MKFTTGQGIDGTKKLIRARKSAECFGDTYVTLESITTATPVFSVRNVRSRHKDEAQVVRNDVSYTHQEGSVFALTIPDINAGEYILEARYVAGGPVIEAMTINVVDFDVQGHFANVGWANFDAEYVLNWMEVVNLHKYYNEPLQALIVNVIGLPTYAKVVAQGHSQDYGWLPEVGNGEVIGVPNANKRLEAFKIKVIDTRDGATLDVISYGASNNFSQYDTTTGANGTQCGVTGQGLPLYNPRFSLTIQ